MPFKANQICNAEVKGLQELNERLKKIGHIAERKGALVMIKTIATTIKAGAKKIVPVKTGRLKKSLIVVKRGRAARGHYYYLIGMRTGRGAKYDGWYGRLVETGTRAHEIKPKKAQALGRKGAFGKLVKHPGIAGQHWLERAFDENWRKALKKGADKYKKFVEQKEKTAGIIGLPE